MRVVASCFEVLVRVLDGVGQLNAEFEDYEADDEADHERLQCSRQRQSILLYSARFEISSGGLTNQEVKEKGLSVQRRRSRYSVGASEFLGLVLIVLAVFRRAGSFECVDHVDDDFDGWD